MALVSAVAVVAALALAASAAYAFPSSAQISATAYPLNLSAVGPGWTFSATINSSSINVGQPILLEVSLMNTASANQTLQRIVEPFIDPGVYNSNGTEVWNWNPPQITRLNLTVASGQVLGGKVIIPTSTLQSGQTYVIKVMPLSLQFVYPTNFELSFQVSTH